MIVAFAPASALTCDLLLGQQRRDILRVVHHLVVAAELRILVHQRVVAVGALRQDQLELVTVERLDILPGELLEQILIARAAGRVAGAGFLLAQDGEVDAARRAGSWRWRV